MLSIYHGELWVSVLSHSDTSVFPTNSRQKEPICITELKARWPGVTHWWKRYFWYSSAACRLMIERSCDSVEGMTVSERLTVSLNAAAASFAGLFLQSSARRLLAVSFLLYPALIVSHNNNTIHVELFICFLSKETQAVKWLNVHV